ncbi:SYJ2 [Enterospora canceri]|uniref:SYJ2 n=1 Tax=Enterospora canceri TaxID=1081671 RepID=A0A1Y1S6K7_9MICR|nr:SYJ2 [Enterospora canceri]
MSSEYWSNRYSIAESSSHSFSAIFSSFCNSKSISILGKIVCLKPVMTYKLFVVTWNCGDVPEIDLDVLLNGIGTDGADIVVLNLQEANRFKMNTREATKVVKMGQIITIIISKISREITVHKLGLGFFGYTNKGCIFTEIGDLVMCNIHLSPDEENVLMRENQLKDILESVNSACDKIVLAGDFNFRSNFDESRNLMKMNTIKLKEGTIDFDVTYKYTKGSNHIDKSRKSAYCDRIFTSEIIDINQYGSKQDENISDHKPVYLVGRVNEISEGNKNMVDIGASNKIIAKVYENKYIAICVVVAVMLFLAK